MTALLWCCDGSHPGADNMERDRALWQKFEADPTGGVRLRIYGWSPPALSLGFHQPESAVDHEALARRGFDLVRRPTGGAAVLHIDEITYSVTARLGLEGSSASSSAVAIRAMRLPGLVPGRAPGGRFSRNGRACATQ